jgi:hypothetical protein
MADWGLYTALRGRDNWAQRRQDKAMNMQIVQQQAANEEKKTQQEMLAEEGINKYLDEMAAIKVLPEDQERIKEVERSARQNIIQGIARNNGDLSRYVSSGGITDLHEYRNSIIQSKEVKTALSNKENMALIIADKQKGNRWFSPVDVPQTDENGEPILDEDGNAKTQKVSIDDQLKLYKRGSINTISYNGSENKVNLNAMSFHGTPKDPKNPYSKDNIVTAADIKFQAMEAGASEEYANELAKSYYKTASDAKAKGQDATWKWGNKSEEERLLMEAKRDKLNASSGGGGEDTNIKNQVFPKLQTMKTGTEMLMDGKASEWWKTTLGLNYDSETNTMRPSTALFGYDADPNSKMEYDLRKALHINPTNKYVVFTDKNGKKQQGIEAEVIFDANTSGQNTVAGSGAFWGMGDEKVKGAGAGWEHKNKSDIGIGTEDQGGDDVWFGKAIIPITKYINTPTVRDRYNKDMNITGKVEGFAPSTTNEDYSNRNNAFVQQFSELNGISYDEAFERLINQ